MKKFRLTREQEDMRLRGLRILARMIVRHHLAVLARNGEKTDASRSGKGGTEAGTVLDLQEEGNDG